MPDGTLGQLQAEGKLQDHHAALAKAFTTVRMRETVAWGREVFGAKGIVSDYNVGVLRGCGSAEGLSLEASLFGLCAGTEDKKDPHRVERNAGSAPPPG